MSQIRIWSGEELTVVFQADFELTDYGVAGSPKWWEMTDLRILSVHLLDVELPITSLTPEMKTTIEALSDEIEWADAPSD